MNRKQVIFGVRKPVVALRNGIRYGLVALSTSMTGLLSRARRGSCRRMSYKKLVSTVFLYDSEVGLYGRRIV